MNAGPSPAGSDAEQEITALIETLHESEKRLEELTGGEVDTVADHQGRTIVLRRAQDQLRQAEAARQAAVLNALPAHIALLDTGGIILSVNEAWRKFAVANSLHSPGYAVGVNYLAVCDDAHGENSSESRQVAAGIRSVILQKAGDFSIEYPCHSPTEERWFRLSVTPLSVGIPGGVVVMHLDITAERSAEENLRESESRFRQMADNIRDVFFLRDADGMRMLYISPAYEEIWGRSRESLYANPATWLDSIHPDDQASTREKARKGVLKGKFDLEFRIVRPDGSTRWIESSGFPVRDGIGNILRIAGFARDVTDRKRSEETLKLFGTAMNAISDAVYLVDRNSMSFVHVNDAACRMQNKTGEELLALGPVDMIGVPRRELERTYDSAIRGGDGAKPHVMIRSREDGSRMWVETRRHAMLLGDRWMIVTLVRDVTERKKEQDRIVYLNRVYAVLSGINTLIVHVSDRDELFREACRIAIETGGFRMAWIGIVDRSTMKLVLAGSAGMDEAFQSEVKIRFSSAESGLKGNTPATRAIRERKPVVSNDLQSDSTVAFGAKYAASGIRSLVVLPLIVSDEVVGVFGMHAREAEFFHAEEMALLSELADDIAFAIDHIDKRERLTYLAYYDSLTGLANRTLLHERLEQIVVNARLERRKAALILLNIERFKNINDTLGRPAGDALLKVVAARMSSATTSVGRLARIEADQFAVVIPEVENEEALVRLIEQRIEEVFQPPFHIGDSDLRISARFGIAMFPADGADADTLLRNAEAALRDAKAAGERYLFYTRKMNARIAEKLSLENRLRQALDKGEFVLHYQPKINLLSGRLTGAEALIRWNNPRTGLVPPGHFIPVLEETGLINEVGRWALRQAVTDYLIWRAAGLPAMRIAVNVSPLQLRGRGFVSEIEKALSVDAHAADGLELEITESLIMADVQLSIASLRAIRATGVTVAIDDFGTGFSSLSYLAKLPVDTLKIDRSFVIEMTTGPEGLALVSTIINLAHSLKLNVVAEGVETEEQSRLLRLLGCDEVQGFLFSKALPADIFEKLFLTPSPSA